MPVLMPRLPLTDAQKLIDTTYLGGPKINNPVLEFYEHSDMQTVEKTGRYRCLLKRSARAASSPSTPRELANSQTKLFIPPRRTDFLCDICPSLRRLLADYVIAKIQSGIGEDITLMRATGIDVRALSTQAPYIYCSTQNQLNQVSM
jgi:hypothetical protein